MIGIQIVAIIFALGMIYLSFLHFRRGEFGKIEFALWQILWVGLGVVVIYPQSVRFILRAFSISRTFDLVVVIGIVVSFGVTFRNYVIVKRIEKRVEEFTREESLKGVKK
ncbi:MAG: DUF2304 domain-containing protein [Patescibacteria group bacterium]|jgi:hypothetical protein